MKISSITWDFNYPKIGLKSLRRRDLEAKPLAGPAWEQPRPACGRFRVLGSSASPHHEKDAGLIHVTGSGFRAEGAAQLAVLHMSNTNVRAGIMMATSRRLES